MKELISSPYTDEPAYGNPESYASSRQSYVWNYASWKNNLNHVDKANGLHSKDVNVANNFIPAYSKSQSVTSPESEEDVDTTSYSSENYSITCTELEEDANTTSNSFENYSITCTESEEDANTTSNSYSITCTESEEDADATSNSFENYSITCTESEQDGVLVFSGRMNSYSITPPEGTFVFTSVHKRSYSITPSESKQEDLDTSSESRFITPPPGSDQEDVDTIKYFSESHISTESEWGDIIEHSSSESHTITPEPEQEDVDTAVTKVIGTTDSGTEDYFNIILIGKTGQGKSTLGNKLLSLKNADRSSPETGQGASLLEKEQEDVNAAKHFSATCSEDFVASTSPQEKTRRPWKKGASTAFIMLVHAVVLPLLLLTDVTSCQVIVLPSEDFVSIPGSSAAFFCVSLVDRIESATWFLNGTLLEDTDTDLHNVGMTTLRFSPVSLAHNGTRVMCSAQHESGEIFNSPTSLLLIQDLLSAVGSLRITTLSTTLYLTWTAPFTLDISGIDPDISGYCVGVVNSTSSSTLHSECGITETEFSYPILPDAACHIYTFTVTPVNVVGMGEPATVAYVGAKAFSGEVNLQRMPHNAKDHIFTYRLYFSAPVCGGELTSFVDIDTGEIVDATRIQDVDFNITGDSIIFTTDDLRINRRYNVTVVTTNSASAEPTVSNVMLSTHDIRNATFKKMNDEFDVVTSYFQQSDAMGALFLVIYITGIGDVDFERSFLLALDRNASHNHTLPFKFFAEAGHYRVHAYDIEEDGTLATGVCYPAVVDELTPSPSVQGFLPTLPLPGNCRIRTSLYNISAECTYLSAPRAIGFQMIVQLGVIGQVHRIYVDRTMDLETPATVEVNESGLYLVSIIPILEGMGITDSDVEYREILMVTTLPDTTTSKGFAAAVIAGLIIILIVVLVVLVIKLEKRKSRKVTIDPKLSYHSQESPKWRISTN